MTESSQSTTTNSHSTNLDTNRTKVNLKYGMNPHQSSSSVSFKSIIDENGTILEPFKLINGVMGYINVLDFIHGWLTVYEIGKATHQIAFISMKHTSPAGLAIGTNTELSDDILDIFGVSESMRCQLTPCARAFIKSRNCDPLSSFGDFICCNSIVDEVTAKLIKREVCDGIAAPGFSPEALEILKSKKGGKFIVIEMDVVYCEYMLKHGWIESKEIYGMLLEQPYNNFVFNEEITGISVDDYDSIMAYYVLKYSQSNNVSMLYDGQMLGLGCGQQNRVACVKLAGGKATVWRLRHHPKVVSYYKNLDNGLKRQEKVNLVYEYIDKNSSELMKSIPKVNITLGSDGFFPFTDNIIEAHRFGVIKILQPGGSVMDDRVNEECKRLNIELYNIGTRMFYH